MIRLLLISALLILLLFFIIILILGLLLPSQDLHTENEAGNYVLIDNHKIYYEFYNRNSEKTLVFLHSFGGNCRMWDSLIVYFPDKNILVYDMIGFGNSDRPEMDYSLESQSYYLNKLLKELQINKIIIVGSSMGASVALYFSSKFSDSVEKAIVMAPSAYPGSMNHKFPGNLFYKPGILNSLGKFFTSNFLFNTLFQNSIGYQALSVTSSYNESFSVALENIKKPVLLFWSKGDKRSDFNFSEIYLKKIKVSKMIVKPDEAGHNIHSYKPELLSQEINEFINK